MCDGQVEDEQKTQLPSKQGTAPEQTTKLEESIYKVSGQLSTITRNQKYFRTRENRNFSTVRSTEGRIVNFSLIQCAMVICMGALQVFVVRFFFQVSTPTPYRVYLKSLLLIVDYRVPAKVTYERSVPSGVGMVRRRILQAWIWRTDVRIGSTWCIIRT